VHVYCVCAEQRLAEEKRQWLEIESKRMEEEKEEQTPILARRAKQMAAAEAKREDKEEWENFIACTHLPDFRSDAELSTFITLWEEEPDRDLDQVLKETQQACEVIDGLEKMAAQATGRKDFEMADKSRNYIKKLRELTKYKLDHASAELLEHLTPYIDPKDNTCQHSLGTALQRYGIWVNTTRNVRIKAIEYQNLGLKTDIPRTIILQTVAVRMMHFRKDLVSPFVSGDYFTIGGVLFIECLGVPDRPKQTKSHVPDLKDAGNWNFIKVTAAKGEVERQPYPPIDPTTGQMQTVGVPPMKVEWLLPADILIPEGSSPIIGWWDERGEEPRWNNEGITDIELEEREGVGRMLSFSTVHLTALAILQVVSHLLCNLWSVYMCCVVHAHCRRACVVPLAHTFSISPSSCALFLFSPTRVRNHSVLLSPVFMSMFYTEPNARLFLAPDGTALSCLDQSRWSCFPFQSWMLQPMAPNKAMLTLKLKVCCNIHTNAHTCQRNAGKLVHQIQNRLNFTGLVCFQGGFMIKLEIGAGECRLLYPPDESLRPLREKPRRPMEMLRLLQQYGINLIPIDADAEGACVCARDVRCVLILRPMHACT
jgi:hypothetical protein